MRRNIFKVSTKALGVTPVLAFLAFSRKSENKSKQLDQLTPAQFKAKVKADAARRLRDQTMYHATADHYGKNSVTEDDTREVAYVTPDVFTRHVHHLDADKPQQVASVVVQSERTKEDVERTFAPLVHAEAMRQATAHILLHDALLKERAKSDYQPYQSMDLPPIGVHFRVANNAGGQHFQGLVNQMGSIRLNKIDVLSLAKKYNLEPATVDKFADKDVPLHMDVLSTGDSMVDVGAKVVTRVVGGYEDSQSVQRALASRGNSALLAVPMGSKTSDPAVWARVAYYVNQDVAEALKGLDLSKPQTQAFQVAVGKTLAKTVTSGSAEWVAERGLGV
jgi:hypothetical protein